MSLKISWKKTLLFNPANNSYSVYLPKELAEPLKEKGIREFEIWYDQKEGIIKLAPVLAPVENSVKRLKEA